MEITEVPHEKWARHVPVCRRMMDEGHDVESVLRYLRESEVSKIESLVILVELLGITNDKAKLVVHYSETWRDTRRGDEQLHSGLVESVEALLARRKK